MENDLRVLLVEDDPEECKNLIKCAENTDGIRLVGVSNSSDMAIELVSDCVPDAVILDIELHNGSGNGIFFMQKLRALNPVIYPYILITTNNISKLTHELVREQGADFIMSKYQDDYNAENVIELLKSVKSVIHGKKKKSMSASPRDFLSIHEREELDKKLLKKIHTEMDLIGVSHKMSGRRYLIDGIIKTISNPEPNLSKYLSAKYKKSPSTIERSVQNAINSTWKNSNIELLKKHYKARINPLKGVPTITEFVFYYAEKIKINY
ncbi:MAG: response regulator [Oscillospiraceae bacterium]|nr:response regulator [Oscillospiraceae bacterium]